MATIQQLETALRNAHAAGDTDAARRLANAILQGREELRSTEGIPGFEDVQVPGTVPQKPEPTFGEQVIGAGETALTMATGATTGAMGMIGGTLKGIAQEMLSGQFGSEEAARRIEEEAMKGMQALTYAPKTETGQEYTEAVGEVAQEFIPVAPLTAEMGVVAQAAKAAIPIARTAASQRVVAPAIEGARQVAERVKAMAPTSTATPGTGRAAGAEAVDIATQRQMQAGELPVPIQLTEGQKTRTFEQQRFERETAKLPEVGGPIRERFAQQNLQLQQNMDAFIDSTGAELTTVRGVGEVVDKALRERAAKDKTKIRTLYKEAEKAGEMEDPVNVEGVINLLNESRSAESTAPVLVAARKELVRLGAATETAEGGLAANLQQITLNNTEQFRKFINKVTGTDATNIKFAGDIKRAVDASTEGLGGDKYKQARAARTKYAKEYENVGLAKQLLNTKRGSDDRAIAMEDVLNKVILSPSTSLDSMRHVRRLLQTGGVETGKQAWKELQGGTLRHIQEQMTKSVGRDQLGNPVVSPAALDKVITQLDKTGKLDFIFGKKGAEQLRTINEVAKDVLTAPLGVVNTSNTASVLAGLMDVAISGTAGVPAPILTSFRILTKSVKDAKLRARVKRSLGD